MTRHRGGRLKPFRWLLIVALVVIVVGAIDGFDLMRPAEKAAGFWRRVSFGR